jgi:membrane protein implicated in regulation of membrane protease activity
VVLDSASWTAIAFLMLGLFLVVAEIWMPGYFIAVPGGALAFMGAIGLAAPDLMFGSPWSWFLWPVAAVLSTTLNLLFYRKWAPAAASPLTLGADSLPGETGTVVHDVTPGPHGTGKVRIRGQTWSARAEAPIAKGTPIRVVRVEGLYAIVEPAGPAPP